MDEERLREVIGRVLDEQHHALAMAFSSIVSDEDRPKVLVKLKAARKMLYERGEPVGQVLLDRVIAVLEHLEKSRPPKKR